MVRDAAPGLSWLQEGDIVKQYRPNVERQKELYSRMKAREIFRRLRSGSAHPARIPDNAEPWLSGGVHSVADALHVSEQIKKTIKEWNLPRTPQS